MNAANIVNIDSALDGLDRERVVVEAFERGATHVCFVEGSSCPASGPRPRLTGSSGGGRDENRDENGEMLEGVS